MHDFGLLYQSILADMQFELYLSDSLKVGCDHNSLEVTVETLKALRRRSIQRLRRNRRRDGRRTFEIGRHRLCRCRRGALQAPSYSTNCAFCDCPSCCDRLFGCKSPKTNGVCRRELYSRTIPVETPLR